MTNYNTALDLVNNAIVLLGDKPIMSFVDDSLMAKKLYISYDTWKKSYLSSYTWNFNEKTEQLTRTVEAPNNPRFKYRYILPQDCFQTVEVLDAKGNTQYDWQRSGSWIFANKTDLYLTFQTDVFEGDMPYWYQTAFIAYITMQLARAFTFDEAAITRFTTDFRGADINAKIQDSNENPYYSIYSENSGYLPYRN